MNFSTQIKIKFPKANSFVSQISISEDDKILALGCYKQNHVLIYDFKKNLLLKKINILAPHGILIYKNFLLISHKFNKSIRIIIYNLNNFKIISRFKFDTNYFIAHSMSISKDSLFITLCEGDNKIGSVINLKFNHLIGKIDKILQTINKPFFSLGDTKGVCVNEKRNLLFVSFETEPINFYNLIINKFRFFFLKDKLVEINDKSGLAIFEIYSDGKISEKPLKVIKFDKNSRPEDVRIYKNKLATVDLVNNVIFIYNISSKFELKLIKKLYHNLNSPHQAHFYDNGKKLLVCNTFIKIFNQKAQFFFFNKSTTNNLISYNLLL
jgi:WD40 repeat protein